MESFDPIGRWRGHYALATTHVPIDSSGQFGATQFKDVSGFKTELLNRREMFARCLTEKLLVHALGRELGVVDRPYVRAIVETAASATVVVRANIVLLCIESELFQQK